jgi:hypothetical protein
MRAPARSTVVTKYVPAVATRILLEDAERALDPDGPLATTLKR